MQNEQVEKKISQPTTLYFHVFLKGCKLVRTLQMLMWMLKLPQIALPLLASLVLQKELNKYLALKARQLNNVVFSKRFNKYYSFKNLSQGIITGPITQTMKLSLYHLAAVTESQMFNL